MQLFADASPNVASIVLGAVGVLAVAVIPVIVKALNDRAASRADVKQKELDYLFAKNKELLARATEQLERVEKESRELQAKHRDCEIRLARAEERIALLERNEAERDGSGRREGAGS
jgi:hypothetical protein